MIVNVNPLSDVSKLCVTSLTDMGRAEVRVLEISTDDSLVGSPGSECPPSYLNTAQMLAIPSGISHMSISTLL